VTADDLSILVVADSDSYLKWGAGMLGALPAEWSAELVLLATPVAPSESQKATALAASSLRPDDVAVARFSELCERIVRSRPDVVLVSTRGPVARVLVDWLAALGPFRPVIVTGLPGISIPATKRALIYRARADLFVLHSHREVREFRELALLRGSTLRFGLTTLPFLTGRRTPELDKTDIVFAAQAKVPSLRADRERMLGWLLDAARRHPEVRVILKLRAERGEQQTHREEFGYADLLRETAEVPDNLVVSSGPMDAQLDTALALVTVSSTAIVEAVDRGVRVLAIDDFGVGPEQINEAFEGSGLFGPSSDLVDLRFHDVEKSWLDDNYFHDQASNDWLRQLEALVSVRGTEGLPHHPRIVRGGDSTFRRAWDRKRALGADDSTPLGYLALIIGTPLRWLLLLVRRMHRRLRLVWTDGTPAEHRPGGDPVGAGHDRIDQR
jgi:hypothetical protein